MTTSAVRRSQAGTSPRDSQRGQMIDKKIKAALDQLHEKMAAGNLHQLIQDDQLKAEQTKVRNRWIAAGSVSGPRSSVWGSAER